MSSSHGAIHWSELMTRDSAAARKFFETVVGWTTEEWAMGGGAPYIVCAAEGRPVAGIMQMAGSDFDGVPPHWMTYVAVDDVDAAAAKVAAAGGDTVRPAFDVPGVGRIVIVRDPTGGVVGLMTPAPREAA